MTKCKLISRKINADKALWQEVAVIDFNALQEIKDMAGDMGAELIVEVIDIYLEESSQHLSKMRTAATTGDAPMLRNAAHSLKSSSASLGATTLSMLCKDLEAMGRSGTTAQATVILSQVEAEYEKVKLALQQERQHTSDKS